MLGGKRGRRCCHGRWRLEVHIATGARLFGPGRATAPRGVPVHTGTLAAPHFPTAEGRVGEDGGEDKEEKERGRVEEKKMRWGKESEDKCGKELNVRVIGERSKRKKVKQEQKYKRKKKSDMIGDI